MTYTRKPREPRSVTFRVPWIEEPVTMPTVNSMPHNTLVQLTRDDNPDPIVEVMPDEISTLLNAASGKEFGQFMEAWGTASEKDEKESARTESIFERLIRGLS